MNDNFLDNSEKCREGFSRFETAVNNFSVGFHKSVVLTSVTGHSMRIVEANLAQSQASLATIVSAFEEIRATSESTSSNTEKINSGIKTYLDRAATMQNRLESRVTELEAAESEAGTIDQMFTDLRSNSSEIANMTKQIEDVSERTNILAINASIEAARVGTQGAGFRVIANEIRNLALQTSDFAKTIAGTIDAFSGTVERINGQLAGFTDLMGRVVSDLQGVRRENAQNNELGQGMSQSIQQIHTSTEEQTMALTDGLSNLETAFTLLQETYSVTQALDSVHHSLDALLNDKK